MEYYSALKKNVIPLWQEIWSILCQDIQAGLPSRVLLTAKGKMTIENNILGESPVRQSLPASRLPSYD